MGPSTASHFGLPTLRCGGVKHNVVFVTTQHDSLFAFDGDSEFVRAALVDQFDRRRSWRIERRNFRSDQVGWHRFYPHPAGSRRQRYAGDRCLQRHSVCRFQVHQCRADNVLSAAARDRYHDGKGKDRIAGGHRGHLPRHGRWRHHGRLQRQATNPASRPCARQWHRLHCVGLDEDIVALVRLDHGLHTQRR